MCGESWCSGCARPAAPLSPGAQEQESKRLRDIAEDYMREAAENAEDRRRAAAPSLPMDLCSDIPERCGLCGAILAEVDTGLATTSCENCRGDIPEDDR